MLDGDRELRRVERALAQAEAAHDNDGRSRTCTTSTSSMDGYSARSRAARILDGLGFSQADLQRPVAEFSGGWRMRLNLAQALLCPSDLLLLDEPTNHLDLDAVFWLEEWLRRYPGTLLLISHDREFLDATVDHICHLEGRGLRLYKGNYSEFERQRAANLANQQAAFEKQQREIAHLRSFVERFRAKATKARQAQSRLKTLARMEVIAAAHVCTPFTFAFRAPEPASERLLTLEQAQRGLWRTPCWPSVDLALTAGARVGLLGANGAGKSTLVKLLAGELVPFGGRRAGGQGPEDRLLRPASARAAARGGDAAAAPDARRSPSARAGPAGLSGRIRFPRGRGRCPGGPFLRRRESAAHARVDHLAAPQPAAAGRAHQPPRPGDAPGADHGAAGVRGRDGPGVT